MFPIFINKIRLIRYPRFWAVNCLPVGSLPSTPVGALAADSKLSSSLVDSVEPHGVDVLSPNSCRFCAGFSPAGMAALLRCHSWQPPQVPPVLSRVLSAGWQPSFTAGWRPRGRQTDVCSPPSSIRMDLMKLKANFGRAGFAPVSLRQLAALLRRQYWRPRFYLLGSICALSHSKNTNNQNYNAPRGVTNTGSSSVPVI